MKFKKTTLPNGLRLITVPMKSPTTTVLVMVETGSGYEAKAESGISHFLEHMCFKGTAKRPATIDISRELDGLGAYNNAFTSYEMTGYFAKAQKRDWKKILEILSDMYLNPTLPEPDLEKERGVILQELNMYEDQPQAQVWQVLSRLMYGDTAAGRPVIGLSENIKKFSRSDFVGYRDKHYVAGKTIVIVCGDVDESEVKREVDKQFRSIPKARRVAKEPVKDKQSSPGLLVHQKKTDQTHMIMGFRGVPARDERVPALTILSTLLGGGMSSRLWHRLREDMGVCYYVKVHNDESTDHGLFAIETGVDPKRVCEVVQAILEECSKLTKTEISDEELDRAKEHSVGHMYMGLETTNNVAEFAAVQEVTRGKISTPEEWEKAIRAVTAAEVRKVAGVLFHNKNLNLALVGHLKDEGAVKRVLRF